MISKGGFLMDKSKLVITIERQYGSGGRIVGKKLAEELGIPFYDDEILSMTAEKSAVGEKYFRLADEKAGNNLLRKIVGNLRFPVGIFDEPKTEGDVTSPDNLFRFQSEVIRKLAAEENCIIMGRCADYVLEGMEGLVRIFIYADMDFREKRTIEKEYYTAKDAKKNIKRIDRERRDYFRYYTGKEWESPDNYDLMINTAAVGINGAVETIKNYLKTRGFQI